jgi:glutamine cyclotransferase
MSGIRTHDLSNQAVNTYALDRAAFGAGSESIGGGIIQCYTSYEHSHLRQQNKTDWKTSKEKHPAQWQIPDTLIHFIGEKNLL